MILDTINSVGACSRPVVIACGCDGVEHTHLLRCKTRIASDCASCAQLYRQDARAIVYDGLDRGQAATFLTLTAPSFGRTHYVAKGRDRKGTRQAVARPERCSCGTVHSLDDDLLGVPLDLARYDYDGAVAWNAGAGRLWDRFRTALARELGVRPDYIKVAEWQARGSIHLHVLVRGVVPAAVVRRAAREARTIDKESSRVLQFGSQVDAQLVPAGSGGAQLRARRGGYVAKLVTYAIKDMHRSQPRARAHLARLAEAAARLAHQRGERLADECAGEHQHEVVDEQTGEILPGNSYRLACSEPETRRVAQPRCQGIHEASLTGNGCRSRLHRQHGWRGHVITKSRGWSEKTFSSERQRRERATEAERAAEGRSVATSAHAWRYVGVDREVAAAARLARAREVRPDLFGGS